MSPCAARAPSKPTASAIEHLAGGPGLPGFAHVADAERDHGLLDRLPRLLGAGALRTKRTVHRQDLVARLSYSIPTFAGVWLLLKGSSDPRPLADRILPHAVPLLAIALLVTLAGLPLVVAGVWLKLGQEEALMTRHFPAEYPVYRSQVRALIPRLL
jgi:protein-S-isoprenylcysteine O-methyltransferase Ste14